MYKPVKTLSGKLGFLAAVGLAAVIGGVSTGVVMAAIPDSNGNLNACYRNNGGDLRVLDTATDACGNNETPLNLSQALSNNAATAYFRVIDGAVDTAALRNIADHEWSTATKGAGWCIETSFTPNIGIGHDVLGGGMIPVMIEGGGTGAGSPNEYCAANFNAFVQFDSTAATTASIAAWFSK